jgi:peroxiredoxin
MRSYLVIPFVLLACNDKPAPDTATPGKVVEAKPVEAKSAPVAGKAEIGKPAPDFALKDLDGKEVRLSSFKGKKVVLEWFNPGCPFVKASHTKGSLVSAAKKTMASGVVWLSINSSAEGKQGFGVDANKDGAKTFGMENPVLLDADGSVGHTYGATNTPHMMVIDEKGVLVYRGAIDNSPDGEGQSAPDANGKGLVNYVDSALADIGAGKPVSTSETKAYGCSVKYK